MHPHEITAGVDRHIRTFFRGHAVVHKQWESGPARDRLPDLRVLEIGPGPKTSTWTYVTCGAWDVNRQSPFEYLMTVDEPTPRYVDLLTMVAFYGRDRTLGLGHVIPIGGPSSRGRPASTST